MERFGVKCSGILLRTWSKAQGRKSVTGRWGVGEVGSRGSGAPLSGSFYALSFSWGSSLFGDAEANLLLKFRKMGRTPWEALDC